MFRWKKTITDDAGALVDAHDLSSPTDERARDADSLTALNALLMQEVYVSTRGNLAGPQLMYITAGITGLVVLALVRTVFPASPAFMSYIAAGVVAGAQVVVGLRWHAARATATIVATMPRTAAAVRAAIRCERSSLMPTGEPSVPSAARRGTARGSARRASVWAV